MTYDVAIIGTGENPDDPDRDGYAMAYRHAPGYQRLADCEVVACADIVRERAEAFADEFGLSGVYEDYSVMIESENPDIVSICVPPAAHAEIVVDCATHGDVAAIHCEKPMAVTWNECRQMVDVCANRDVQLTFNHQLRFGGPYRAAKALIDDGAIGALQRIEFREDNLFDAGAHQFDLCHYFVDQAAVEWVLAQIDYRDPNVWFGTHNENQAITQWRYENGVFGIGSTGGGDDFVGCQLRLIGKRGTIEIGPSTGSVVRIRQPGSGWTAVETHGDGIYGPQGVGRLRSVVGKLAAITPIDRSHQTDRRTYVERAIASVVNALDTGVESELSAANALQATEVIFASWASARRRARIDFPLQIEDNPLESMVEGGQLDVTV